MNIIEFLIPIQYREYKCFTLLKKLIETNPEVKKIIIKGYLDGSITGFTEVIWEEIRNQNIRRINSFEDVFIDGANIGYCTVAAKQLSYSFDSCYLCGGILSILKGTPNSIDGSHTWILVDGKIIDTTLMIMLDERYSKKIGYKEENRYNPCVDSIYLSAREFTRDLNLKNNRSCYK